MSSFTQQFDRLQIRQIILPSGNASDLPLTFANDTTKGFYFDVDMDQIVAVGLSGGGSGATQQLDNLAAVAINTDLLPGVDNTISLGNGGHNFKDLWLGGNATVNGAIFNSDGTLSDPSYSFDSDSTTGLSLASAAVLAVSANSLVSAHFDDSTTPGDTRLKVWNVDTASLESVVTSSQLPAAGANTALSNLVPTSIDQNLRPASDGGQDLGENGLNWNHLWVTNNIYFDSNTNNHIGYNGVDDFRIEASNANGGIQITSTITQMFGGGHNGIKVDGNTTANETTLLVWDITANTFQRVSLGDPDSGGTGFRVLRIPN